MGRWHDGASEISSTVGVRYFARRSGGSLEDAEEELREMQDDGKKRMKDVSAADMEFYTNLMDDDDEEEDDEATADEEYRLRQQEIQLELDSRTGRVWKDPWEITEEQWMSTATVDDLPEWSPEFVSRVSQERVQIYPEGVPTLSSLASIPLPPAASPHPGLGQAKDYAAYRKDYHYRYLAEKVRDMAQPRIEGILALSDWDDKQEAVDKLFETIEADLHKAEAVLGKHPQFGKWVERAVEEYLQSVKKGKTSATISDDDSTAKPVFMDCYDNTDGDQMVPSILSPLQPHPRDGPGRMVEEWELSAHKKTKRILLRQCTKTVAKTLEENNSARIFVHGRKGVGKSALLASIVASARKSGQIVLYLPDGDRLRKNGYFITPNSKREGMFDLQNLSQEICAQLLTSHEADLQGMKADKESMEKYFKDSQLERIADYSGDGILLVDLLEHAQERKNHAPMCYSVVVDYLMNQDDKPFLIVMDEFNGLYDHGHYFHMAYDEDVRKSIPYERINLFEQAMAAMSLSTTEDDEPTSNHKEIKRGGIIVAVSESHAIRRKVTDALVKSAESQVNMHVVEVPRFSDIEADHILANFEATGVGKLRLDRGDTVMDDEEVAYLKMVSGCIGQQLLDASVI
eukprot:scaffold6638_cov127-Cylindrotheca_fusiformis.AAC.26